MKYERSLDIVFAIISSIVIVISVLVGGGDVSFILLGVFPLLDAFAFCYLSYYSNILNFCFGIIRVIVLTMCHVNYSPPRRSSADIFNFLDVVAIVLMVPSLLLNKRKKLNHLFLYLLFLQTQIDNDREHYAFRFVLVELCFLSFALIGISKINVQDRLNEQLITHYLLQSKLDAQKQNLTKSFQSAVGWKTFKKDFTIDPHLFVTNSRLNNRHGVYQEEETIHNRLLSSTILKHHNISKFKKTVNASRSFNNINRTDCILIAIKPFADNTLTSCNAQNVYDMFQISSKVNSLAKQYGITIVRKFGDVWIGCLGFFRMGRAVSENLLDVLGMAKDIYEYGEQNNIKFTCAVDCGNMFCGFFRGIFQFEVLGPEVMWILSVCEFEREKEIFVSDSMHTLCKRRLSTIPNNPYKFESILLKNVDKFHAGSNYILILDNSKMKQARVGAKICSENIFLQDKIIATNFNLLSQRERNTITKQVEEEEKIQIHIDSTLSILKSIVLSDLHARAMNMVKMMSTITSCSSSAKVGVTTRVASAYSYAEDVSNAMLSQQQPSSPLPSRPLNDEPIASAYLFDQYTNVPFDISTEVCRTIKTVFRKILGGHFDTLYARVCGGIIRLLESELMPSEVGQNQDYLHQPSFDKYRFQLIEPSGYFLNAYVALSLVLSTWAALFVVVDKTHHKTEPTFNHLHIYIACIFMATAFFNWAVRILDYKYVIFPLFNVAVFCIFPSCALGGELGALFVVPTWLMLCFSHRLSHMTCSIFVVLVIMLVGSMLNGDECKGSSRAILFALLVLLFLSSLFILEYILYVCYIVEKIIIPYEKDVLLCYEEAMRDIHQHLPMKTSSPAGGRRDTYDDISKCSVASNLHPTHALTNHFHCFQRCVVIAVHVKATETIPDVGDVDHVSNMLEYIYSLFDECIDKFGIVGISKFSGMHLSVIRDDDSSSESNLKRGVACAQFILMKFRQLDQQKHVNLKLGLCLNYGPLNLGMFEDNSCVYFDMSGTTRDQALQIALKKDTDLYFSASFLNEVKIAFPDKQFNSFVEGGGSSDPHFSSSNAKWYQLELYDKFNFAGHFGFSHNMKDYNYKQILGKGGNGTVHLLEDQTNKTLVAVKIIARNAMNFEHTRRELSILQDLKHQNIVKIKFCVVKRVEMFIVMEYVRGGTLQQIVDYYASDFGTIRVWFMQLVLALEYIHERGIIHRDVKPSNCMIDTFGVLKLTDFGLALQDIESTSVQGNSVNKNISNYNKTMTQTTTNQEAGRVELSAPSLKLMQNIFPSSVQYNTTVSGNNRPKEGILLIDDDRQRLERTQSLLRKHFIVYSVNNDDEALDFLDHSIKNVNKDNEICLILISIDISGDHINGWGFLNMLWSTDELRAIPVIALTSSLSLELAKTKIWEERLPNIKERPKQIIYHPFDDEAYEANRYYFDMVCRLEKQRKNLGDIKASTVFDKMFSDSYYSRRQQCVPSEKTEQSDSLRDVTSTKITSVAGTINYMAPEVINKEECNEKIDWWSCGATFYYCVMGKKLFDRNSKHLVVREILTVDIGDRLSRCYKVPGDLKDLMHNMLLRDVSRRFSSTDIKQHPFFESVGIVSKGAVKKVFDPIATCKSKLVMPSRTSTAATLPSDTCVLHFKERETHSNDAVNLNGNSNVVHENNDYDKNGNVRNSNTAREASLTVRERSIHGVSKYSSEARLRDRWNMADQNMHGR